jgi:putative ABC transport system ATP-binding protein
MHLLGCLDQPTSGSYRLGGEEMGALSPELLAARRRRIGFVFQSFHLLPRQTAVQNVALPLRYAGVRPEERDQRAAELLQRVGLGDRLDHLPSELSGGQQQRVAVARALIGAPALLLCDEPTGNLDSQSGGEITALLEDLWREGRTLIVVTHDDRIAARARRVVRLLDGRLVADERR